MNKRKILAGCLKKNMITIILFVVMTVINFAVFLLYRLPAEPFIYAEIIIIIIAAILIGTDYVKMKKTLDRLCVTAASKSFELSSMPEPESLEAEGCRIIIENLYKEMQRLENEYADEKNDMQDYYTTWVHQIKTPIAVMKLKISDDEPELKAELFRIEQYVDMVLSYIRLSGETNDLVIEEYELDALIRETVRKYAAWFVLKKLKLDYEPVKIKTVTDKKWFICILEQIISNAIKYTPEGTVRIYYENEKLIISDTGVGIAAEDIPRIFEKGYTGINGRTGKSSRGLGLYHAKKPADKLAIPIYAESTPGKGSRFILDLEEKEI